MKYTKTVLANGLTVVRVPSRDAESVVVDVFVKTGSRSETNAEAGMSHFLEHFLFKGTEKYPTAMSINEIVDGIGGDMNAMTSKESTQFYIKARRKHLGLIMDILADMIQRPLFNEVELEREKGVIVEEMNMHKDSPQSVVGDLLDNTMWPKDPLGRDIIGFKKTIQSFTPQSFRTYMHAHYQPGNMVLGISGYFSEAEFSQLLKKHWSSLPRKKGGGWLRAQDKQSQPRVKVAFKETEQAHIALGFKSFAYEDKRNSSLAVLAAVLGGGMSSRLWDEVREKRGLAYYVRASNISYLDVGQFYITSGVQVGQVEQSVRVILQELERTVLESIGSKEVEKAKEYLKGKTALALEDNQVRLDWYLEQVAFKKKVESPAEIFKRINAVTASQIQAVAKMVFQKKMASLAIVGPYRQPVKFSKLLK